MFFLEDLSYRFLILYVSEREFVIEFWSTFRFLGFRHVNLKVLGMILSTSPAWLAVVDNPPCQPLRPGS